MILNMQTFFEQYSQMRDNLKEFNRIPTPQIAYDSELAKSYSWASFKAQKYLVALKSIRQNASACEAINLIKINDYRLSRPHFFDSFLGKPVDSISFKEIKRFALKELPTLIADLEMNK